MRPRPSAQHSKFYPFGTEGALRFMGMSMTSTARPRGRPKGTGIDDSKTLRDVLNLLAAEDGLRPTTAIHRAGISDPSVVRRLREKLKIVPAATTAPGITKHSSRRSRPVARPQARPSQTPVAPIREIPTEQPPHLEDTRTTASHDENPSGSAPKVSDSGREPHLDIKPGGAAHTVSPPIAGDPQVEALRLAAEASAAMSRLFLHCITFSTQTNPLSLALRSQTIMSEFFAAMLAGKAPPKLP
jgi:hypothetical protein